MKYTILTIKGKFTTTQLGQILGKAIYPPKHDNKDSYPCGLAGGHVIDKIYNHWFNDDEGSGSTHVCLHSDGICFSPSLFIDIDIRMCRYLYDKAINKLKE